MVHLKKGRMAGIMIKNNTEKKKVVGINVETVSRTN